MPSVVHPRSQQFVHIPVSGEADTHVAGFKWQSYRRHFVTLNPMCLTGAWLDFRSREHLREEPGRGTLFPPPSAFKTRIVPLADLKEAQCWTQTAA